MLKENQMYAYQRRGVDFIKEKKKCLLFLDMGLGKTTTTLTAMSHLLADFDVFRVLVVAPLRVANTVWKQEAAKWEHLQHLDIGIATGNEIDRIRTILAGHQITVINRENIPWLVARGDWDFDAVVIDESTSFKSHKAQRFKAMKSVMSKVTHMVELTGTPSPQGMQDLWSQLYLVDGGERLGRNITSFMGRFYQRSGFQGYGYTINDGAADNIRSRIQDVCLTMTSEDYLTLPDVLHSYETVQLPEAAKKEYKKLKKEMLITLENEKDILAPSASALNNKLLQMCNGAIYDEHGTWHEIHDAKIQALKELLEDNPNENVLVAYNFKSDLMRLQAAFPEAVALDKKGLAVDQWNEGKIKMLLAHPASAGHGLNMQFGGSTLIYFGLTWSLEYYLQFNKRLHRQGQKSNVRIIHLVVEGGVDEAVVKALTEKNATQQRLIDNLKTYYKEQ